MRAEDRFAGIENRKDDRRQRRDDKLRQYEVDVVTAVIPLVERVGSALACCERLEFFFLLESRDAPEHDSRLIASASTTPIRRDTNVVFLAQPVVLNVVFAVGFEISSQL